MSTYHFVRDFEYDTTHEHERSMLVARLEVVAVVVVVVAVVVEVVVEAVVV